eukprot:CAMPEP_0169468758 /NCGR_PEP_ID=MMETSP1042-20121227/23098_1 /TAXON_ID=464988 /ORGANISM="Hemiselmis andersenii, Strain CCMP1180" /LENGTH=141 /DNA_ID=CAMNT_0009582151 /DNA_START=24 /DNA_END=449 /DNA_ORIENTATION=-
MARMDSQYPDPDRWFGLELACIFNAGDFAGRAAAGRLSGDFSVTMLLLLCALRVFLCPLWVHLASSPLSFGSSHDLVAFGAMAVTSLSNGFLASVAMMRAPGEFNEAGLKEKSSTVMVVAMTVGLASGSILAVPLSGYLRP